MKYQKSQKSEIFKLKKLKKLYIRVSQFLVKIEVIIHTVRVYGFRPVYVKLKKEDLI